MTRTDGPTALLLTRQGLPTLANTSAEGVLRGAYVLSDPAGEGDLTQQVRLHLRPYLHPFVHLKRLSTIGHDRHAIVESPAGRLRANAAS